MSTTTELTEQQQQQLSFEQRYARNGSGFLDVGNALQKISDSKTYRRNYKTFKAYCLTVWGISVARAYQLMDAAVVVTNVQNTCTSSSTRPESPYSPALRTDNSEIRNWVYFIRCKTTGFVKIGKSNNPHKRFLSLSTISPTAIKLLGVIRDDAGRLETELHRRFSGVRKKGEWFAASKPLLEYIEREATPWTK